MQRLMEVVRADRGVGLGPQLLDEHITVNPMARRERQELDDRLCLPQPPRSWCGALDAHREPAQESDPHGSARVAHSRMLPARRSLGKHNRFEARRAEILTITPWPGPVLDTPRGNGTRCYVDDVVVAGMLHAVFAWSDVRVAAERHVWVTPALKAGSMTLETEADAHRAPAAPRSRHRAPANSYTASFRVSCWPRDRPPAS